MTSSGLGGIHGLAEEGEDIRVLVMASDEALRRLAEGEVTNINAAFALQWLGLNRDRLRERWAAA